MIINSGLWNSITLDGIEASISQTYRGHAFLTIYGPEREPGNPWSAYTLFGGLPKDDDSAPFAVLYRKLEVIKNDVGMKGPHGENHPAVFRRFEYLHTEPPEMLLASLAERGIVVKVTKLDHKGNNAEVEVAKRQYAAWIDKNTVIKPNPKIEDMRQRAEREAYCVERQDDKLRKFVYIPLFIVIIAAVIACLVTGHWAIAIAVVLCLIGLYTGFVLWTLWHT